MSDADNYRANFAVCWQRAEKTSDELERRAWLEMAESWRLLIVTDSGSSTVEDFAAGSRGLERVGAHGSGTGIEARRAPGWAGYLFGYFGSFLVLFK
jgi:hypothetical protein